MKQANSGSTGRRVDGRRARLRAWLHGLLSGACTCSAFGTDHCGDPVCGCYCSDQALWVTIVQSATCSGPGITDEVSFGTWCDATGTPRRLRTCEAALAGATNWMGSLPAHALVDSQVLNADWYAPDPLLTLGAAGAVGAQFPTFNAFRGVPDPDDPEAGADPRTVIGLTDAGISGGAHPLAYVDFAVPMRAVWVELDRPTEAGPPYSESCGVRFQHRKHTTGQPDEYVTLASLKSKSSSGGIVINLGEAAFAAQASNGSLTLQDFGIDRVVFDPVEPLTEPIRLTRIANIGWQTMADALAPTSSEFAQPYRLVKIGSLAPGYQHGGLGSDAGGIALQAMWPSTDYRFRLNSRGVIAGTYYRAPAGGGGGGLRAAIWHLAEGSWTRYELEEAPSAVSADMVACALSEPYEAQPGQWVVMVGGWRSTRCAAGGPSSTCGKPHAAAWCVKIATPSSTSTSEPIVPQGVVVVPVSTDCQGTIVDESAIRDLRVVPIGGGSLCSYALGCGAVGMWCAWPSSSSEVRPAMTHAAAFHLRATGPSAYAGETVVLHYANPFECDVATGSGPGGDAKWSTTIASGWIRGATSDQYNFSVVGQWEGDLDCPEQAPDVPCDRYSWAMQWDWNVWGWPAGQEYWEDYPRLRGVPMGTRRVPSSPIGGDDGGGKMTATEPQVPPAPQQVYAAFSAVRSTHVLGGGQSMNVVTSVGWLVNSCFDLHECGCNRHAALFEYPDRVGDGCWRIDPLITKPWILPVIGTNGCLRALDLHDVIWTAGTPDSPSLRPFSKAAAVVALSGGAAENVRLVLGAAYNQTADPQVEILDTQEAVLWRGASPSPALSPYLPESEWCGRGLQTLLRVVNRPIESSATWAALEAATYPGYPSFRPTVMTGQDIAECGSMVCIARLSPTEAYQLCIAVSMCDINADGAVDGWDLGTVLGSWGLANVDGTVDGFDLGALLGAWGQHPVVDFSCDSTALNSQDIAIVLLVVTNMGFESFDNLQMSMSTMPPSQAGYLAEYIKIGVDLVTGGGGSP